MQGIQRRYGPAAGVQVRADSLGGSVLYGYAAVFYDSADAGTQYRLWDRVYERIMPAAFNSALERDDVRALFDHKSELLLGRTKAGTLRLSVDHRGLRYECDLPKAQYALDLLESINRGDITGSSFGFIPRAVMDRKEGDNWVLEVHDLELFDVGPVTFPAYGSTEAGARALGGVDEVRREWERRRAAADMDAVTLALAACEMAD